VELRTVTEPTLIRVIYMVNVISVMGAMNPNSILFRERAAANSFVPSVF
jgi:hypothetical protein